MKSKRCDYPGCRRKVEGCWVEKKQYCQRCFYLKKDENKEIRKEKLNKVGYCNINSCKKRLGYTNKCGLCKYHRDLEKMRIRRKNK